MRRSRPWLGNDWSSETLEHYFQSQEMPSPPSEILQQQSTTRSAIKSSSSQKPTSFFHGVIDPSRIDEIPPEIVGAAKIDRAHAAAPAWAKPIIAYLRNDGLGVSPTLSSEKEREEKLEKTGRPKSTVVRNEMLKILEWFSQSIGLMEPTDRRAARRRSKLTALANMFAVPKPGKLNKDGETMMRVIIDARLANAMSNDSLAFELFTLPALLQCVSNVSHASSAQKKWFCVNADLRHYFHQLPLPERLRDLFLFQCGNKTFRYKTVPMGWYLSPVIAQSITWTLVLGFEWPVHIGRPQNFTSMPAWIPFRSGEGGIFVLLDNIFVVTPDEEVAKYWVQRLKRNAAPDRLNIAFKEEPTVTTIHEDDDNSFTEFLGIDFRFKSWSVKRKDSPAILDRGGTVFTHREISSILGEVLWDLRVRCKSPLEYADLMKVYSAVVPPSGRSWDDAPSWSQEHLSILHKFHSITRRRERCCRLKPWHANISQTIGYAVDACGRDARLDAREENPLMQTAVVDLQADANGRWFKRNHGHDYIGVAELEAIVLAVEDAVKRYPHATLIIIITDSLCAKGWVERLYSDREDARLLLNRIYKILKGRNASAPAIRVSCVYIRSKNNIADVPSREERKISHGTKEVWFGADVQERWERTNWLLREVVNGICSKATTTGHFAVRTERREIPDGTV